MGADTTTAKTATSVMQTAIDVIAGTTTTVATSDAINTKIEAITAVAATTATTITRLERIAIEEMAGTEIVIGSVTATTTGGIVAIVTGPSARGSRIMSVAMTARKQAGMVIGDLSGTADAETPDVNYSYYVTSN